MAKNLTKIEAKLRYFPFIHTKISSFAWNFAILLRFWSGFLPFELPAEEANLARRLFTLKRFQYCRFQNTFQLAFFPSLLSTCRSRLLFASLRKRRKFGVDQRITINMGVNLCHSVVPQASNVILQCMHVYKVILSHANGSSSARRLEVDGRLPNY